jgi:cytochrome c
MKSLIIFSLILFLTSCGNSSETKEQSATESATAKTEVKDPKVANGLELVSKSDCFGCHKLTETSIGPSYAAIASKYKTITPDNMDTLVAQIIKGGSGKWGNVPMTPHPSTSREDAESMVHYIMSIKP